MYMHVYIVVWKLFDREHFIDKSQGKVFLWICDFLKIINLIASDNSHLLTLPRWS